MDVFLRAQRIVVYFKLLTVFLYTKARVSYWLCLLTCSCSFLHLAFIYFKRDEDRQKITGVSKIPAKMSYISETQMTLCKDVKKDIKQIFHAFLFNMRNYLPDVINIQRSEAELNII